jgi:hypothetical protein
MVSLCSKTGTSLLHSNLQRRQKKLREEAFSPMGSQNLDKMLTALFPSISKMVGGNGTEEPTVVPTPSALLICTPSLYPALEELGILGGGGFPLSALTHTFQSNF